MLCNCFFFPRQTKLFFQKLMTEVFWHPCSLSETQNIKMCLEILLAEFVAHSPREQCADSPIKSFYDASSAFDVSDKKTCCSNVNNDRKQEKGNKSNVYLWKWCNLIHYFIVNILHQKHSTSTRFMNILIIIGFRRSIQ